MKRILSILIGITIFISITVHADTQIFYDTFTGTNLTDFVSHTPDIGTSWSEVEDTAGNANWQINAGSARITGGGNSQRLIDVSNPASSTANYYICATVSNLVETTGGSDDTIGFIIRYQDTSNYYGFLIYGSESGTSHVIKIIKKVSGTPSALSSTTQTLASGDTWCLIANGSELSVTQNSSVVSALTVTDTSISVAGKAGLFAGNVLVSTDDMRNVWNIDEYEVWETAATGRTRRIY